jgi:Zn-dependent peptidase ImmA (M78 family)
MDNKGGRPKTEIDLETLNKLIGIQCTAEEIASYFEVSIDTIDRRLQEAYNMGFAEYFKQNKGKGKVSLRRAQFQSAIDGNTTMQIWLGKNWLNQTDKQELTHAGENIIKVKITDD